MEVPEETSLAIPKEMPKENPKVKEVPHSKKSKVNPEENSRGSFKDNSE